MCHLARQAPPPSPPPSCGPESQASVVAAPEMVKVAMIKTTSGIMSLTKTKSSWTEFDNWVKPSP